jgi:hypothetical protein
MTMIEPAKAIGANTWGVRMLKVVNNIREIGQSKNIPIKTYTDTSLAQFLSLPEEKQARLTTAMEEYLAVLTAMPVKGEAPKVSSIQEEVKYLRAAMKRLGLTSNENIEEYIEAGDVIEIYNEQWVQLYRNFEFFRHCSYTLLDLLCNEWYVLYERPKQVIDEMVKCSTDVLNNGTGTVPFRGGDHILRERYLNAKRAFKIKLKYISPLLDEKTGKPAAVLTTLKADLLLEGDDVSKVHMI